MAGYNVADITALKAVTTGGANPPVLRFVASKSARYRFISGDSLTGNDEWIVAATDAGGNWYPEDPIYGTTVPTGQSTRPVTYNRVDGSGVIVGVYINGGGGSTQWKLFSPDSGSVSGSASMVLDAYMSTNLTSAATNTLAFDSENTGTAEWNGTVFTAAQNYSLVMINTQLRTVGSDRRLPFAVTVNGNPVVSGDNAVTTGGLTVTSVSRFISLASGDQVAVRTFLSESYRGDANGADSRFQIVSF